MYGVHSSISDLAPSPPSTRHQARGTPYTGKDNLKPFNIPHCCVLPFFKFLCHPYVYACANMHTHTPYATRNTPILHRKVSQRERLCLNMGTAPLYVQHSFNHCLLFIIHHSSFIIHHSSFIILSHLFRSSMLFINFVRVSHSSILFIYFIRLFNLFIVFIYSIYL